MISDEGGLETGLVCPNDHRLSRPEVATFEADRRWQAVRVAIQRGPVRITRNAPIDTCESFGKWRARQDSKANLQCLCYLQLLPRGSSHAISSLPLFLDVPWQAHHNANHGGDARTIPGRTCLRS
jgi:hypothetical protein